MNYLNFIRPTRWIPKECRDFLDSAEHLKTPPVRVRYVIVKCKQCGDEYPMSPREAYLDPPGPDFGGGAGRGMNPSIGQGEGRFMAERERKLLGCPRCDSHIGYVIRIVRE